VISWFQKCAFHKCNLYHYDALWKLMRAKRRGLRFVGHPGGPGHRAREGTETGRGGGAESAASDDPEPLVFRVNEKMKAKLKEGLTQVQVVNLERQLEYLELGQASHLLPLPAGLYKLSAVNP
jgi:hypothetical protein